MPPALGTPEYTNYLIKQGSTLGMDLGRFTQETTPADATKGSGPVEMPKTETSAPDLSNVKGRVDFNQTVADYYAKQAEAAKAEKEAAGDSKLATLADESLSRFENLPNINEVRTQAKSLTGMDDQAVQDYFAQSQASRKELATLTAQYDNLLAQRDQAIESRRTAGGGTTAGTDMAVAQITRDFNFRLNQQSAIIKTKSAMMEALQGNFTEAQNFITQAVNDATYETKFNLDMFQTFYGRYESQLEKLDSKYNDAIKNSLAAAQDAYTQEYQEKLKLGELMINPDYKNAGITLNDSLETAFAKISSGIAGGTIGNDEAGVGSAQDLLQLSIDADLSPETAARDVALYYQNTLGINVTPKMVDQWTEQARKLKKGEAAETAVEETTGGRQLDPAIESAIRQIQNQNPNLRSGFNVSSKIRSQLKARGFTATQIANSSLGSSLDRGIEAARSFFTSLFSE